MKRHVRIVQHQVQFVNKDQPWFTVEYTSWWCPWRWRPLRVVDRSLAPATFDTLDHARDAARELQLGVRRPDNTVIIEA